MALRKACQVGSSVKNTGKECDISMGPTAMIICVPPALKFTENDLSDPVAFITGLIHAAASQRVYPLFGSKAPIRSINNGAESDVTVTMDDGTTIFVRYGVYNRVYETTSGGLCYAQALTSFNQEGYSFLEVDKTGRLLARKNADGTFSGLLSSFMYAPSPILGDFRSVYRNRFQLSFDPTEMVNNGYIFEGGQALLSLTGLIDTILKKGAAATTTQLFVKVLTECAETNLASLFPNELPLVANFKVTNKVTGAVVPITAATIVGDDVRLTGTFVAGQTYRVTGTAPSVWLANGIEGYDGQTNYVDITV